MIRPTNNPVTLSFGATTPPYTSTSPHRGVDFGWKTASGDDDRTIYMPEDGVVSLIPNNGNDGNGVYFSSSNRFHGLLHTSKYLVSNATFVQKGAPVAVMGETGAAQGVHLHWALKVNGVFVDALRYVDEDKEDDVIKNRHQGRLAYVAIQHRDYNAVTDKEADGLIGKNMEQIVQEWIYNTEKEPSAEWWVNDRAIKTVSGLSEELANLKSQAGSLDKENVLKYVQEHLN